MLFRQLFDHETYTYTYLLADEASKEAVLIDPVIEHVASYKRLLNELGLNLKYALDTHVHADHITALGKLREMFGCVTFLSNKGAVACADEGLSDGQEIVFGDITIRVMFTPGHTDDSYCFYTENNGQPIVFTGDTLLIRGTGRTDFQNGSAEALYSSLHEKLMTLPSETIVYPGHDYKGWTQSTIEEERLHNERINIKDKEKFIEHMANLNLPDPKWMDVAVPANQSCGKENA